MPSTPSMQPSAAQHPAVVVTGASSGIGKELARIAARESEALLLVARSSRSLEVLAEELKLSSPNIAWLPVDLSETDAGDRIEADLRERGWYCDVLVYSAGQGYVGAAWEVDRGDQLHVVDVNARAFTNLALRFLPGMVARRGGGLLVVGSIAGFFPGPNMAVYYATKAYIHSLAASLCAETRGTGVKVTCVSPGFVDTPLLVNSGLLPTRLRKMLPRITAAEAALVGWRAFRAGKGLVVPGLTNRLIVALARMMPVGLVARLIQRLQR